MMKLSKGFIVALIVIGLLVVGSYYLWFSRETFDPVCSWKKPQSVLISLDILESAGEYIDTESAKKGCSATPECTGILSTTAGSTTTYKLTRTQPTVSNTNESMMFIEKGMCKSGTEQPTTGLRGLSDTNTLVVPSMSAATNDAADAARLPDATPPSIPLNAPLSGVVAIPAVGPPPMPATSTLGSTVGESGMLGTNPPGPK